MKVMRGYAINHVIPGFTSGPSITWRHFRRVVVTHSAINLNRDFGWRLDCSVHVRRCCGRLFCAKAPSGRRFIQRHSEKTQNIWIFNSSPVTYTRRLTRREPFNSDGFKNSVVTGLLVKRLPTANNPRKSRNFTRSKWATELQELKQNYCSQSPVTVVISAVNRVILNHVV